MAWRAHGPRLLSTPPAALNESLRTNSSVHDPATRLQRTCAIFGIQIEFDPRRRGKEHLSESAATATLYDEDARLTVVGDWKTGRNAFAKKRCAEQVLNVFREITHCEEWNLDAEGRRIAAFPLHAQLKNAARTGPRDLEWCCLQGHLGTSYVLAGDHEAYDAWSQQVDKLIGDQPTQSDPRLVNFYRRCWETTR